MLCNNYVQWHPLNLGPSPGYENSPSHSPRLTQTVGFPRILCPPNYETTPIIHRLMFFFLIAFVTSILNTFLHQGENGQWGFQPLKANPHFRARQTKSLKHAKPAKETPTTPTMKIVGAVFLFVCRAEKAKGGIKQGEAGCILESRCRTAFQPGRGE